jgi:Ribosomal L38e protein family.
MPHEIKSKEELLKIIPKAIECRVKHNKEEIKIKIRTKNMLYTYKAKDQNEVNEILNNVKVNVINI